MSREHRGFQLAARFRVTLDQIAAAEQARLDAARQRRERGQAERTLVLADLAAFAESLGHFEVKTAKGGSLTWTFCGAQLTFKPKGDADRIDLVAEPLTHDPCLRWQHELGRWVLKEGFKAGGERQRLLFNEGLEALMQKVFSLKPAAEGEVAAPADASSLDDAVPSVRPRTL
jgi:hypothetical protein